MAQMKAIVDKLLTNVSSGYVPTGYISEAILPLIPVVQSSGKLGKYGQSHLRIENSNKGGRGGFRRVNTIARSTASYLVEGHGLEGLVTKEDYRNVEDPFDAERDETMGLTTALWLEKEKVLADSLTSSSILTQYTTLSGVTQFSDFSNSDPISVMITGQAAIKAGCGLPPNTVIMSWEVYNKLRFHPMLVDFLGFKFARPGGLTTDEIAAFFGCQKVFIGMAMYNSAKEGQSDVLANIWGKHIIMAQVPDQAAPFQVSLGYRVGFQGESPRQVSKYPLNNPSGSTGILCEDNYDYLLSNVGAAYLIKDAIA